MVKVTLMERRRVGRRIEWRGNAQALFKRDDISVDSDA